MDHATSMAICRGIGERLERLERVESLPLSPRLQDLVERLDEQDDQTRNLSLSLRDFFPAKLRG
jgi:hypothetical protein